MKKIIILTLGILISNIIYAQDYTKIDSLKTILKTLPELNGTDADTSRMQVCLDIGDLYESYEPDTAILWYSSIADTSYSLEKIKMFPKKAKLNSTLLYFIAYVADNQENYSKAIIFYEHSLKIDEILVDKSGISKCLLNLGIVAYNQGNYSDAISYSERSLKICEEIGDQSGISTCLTNLGVLSSKQNDYSAAKSYYERSLKINEEIGDKSGISTCLTNLGVISSKQNDYSTAKSYYERSLKINEEIGDKSGISTCLTNLGVISYKQNDYSTATTYYKQSLKIYEELDDKTEISNCLMYLGSVSLKQGNDTVAISYFERALKISEELDDQVRISKCIMNLGLVALKQNNDAVAISYYERSLKIYEELNDKAGISSCLINLSVITKGQGNNIAAISYSQRSLELCKKQGDKLGISKCFTNLSSIALEQGNYSDAILYSEQSLKICEELGDKSGISSCFYNLGLVSWKQGNYSNAISYYKRSLKINEELGDKIGISDCLTALGIVASDQGDYSTAILYYEGSLKTCEDFGYKSGISYCLVNLGVVAYRQGKYSDAISYYEQSRKISEEFSNKSLISSCIMNLGDVALIQGNYSLAISYYEYSVNIKEVIGDKANMASNYPSLARAYILLHSSDKALLCYIKSQQIILKLLQDNFTILSEKEKKMYLDKTKGIFNNINEFNLLYGNQYDSIVGICYNNEMLLKGLLLNSTSAMLNAVSVSKDTALKNTYFLLKQIRNQISELQSTPIEERKINIETLESEANELERKLVKMSSQFAETQKLFEYKWQDVQLALKPNEAAIEFIEIKHTIYRSDTCKTDSISYAAIVLKPGDIYPKMIYLCSKDSLSSLFETKKSNEEAFVSNVYRGTGVFLETENIEASTNFSLYSLIWKPLEKHLEGINTVIYAPAGLLNRISFAAIMTPEKKYLSDKINLISVSSTKVLIENKLYEPFKIQSVALFGGINYESDSLLANNLSKWYKFTNDTLNTAFNNTRSSSQNAWKYLPGTLSETQTIQKLLLKKGITSSIFSGYQATEEQFKSFAKEKSPEIIHISTHGFSIPINDKQTEYKIYENSFVQNSNPLFRTGLLFAGANRTWSKSKPINGIEDGILTAYEVSNMNLQNTKLVVLSACETGLGDVKGSEGVYGLQRAFKMAGVKYIIVSLWQVPDKETAEFMESFYSNLLKLNDVRMAFNTTQTSMRKKYEPYYWAAFVLME